MTPNASLFTRRQAVLIGACIAVMWLVGPLADRLMTGQPLPPLVLCGLLLLGVKGAASAIITYFLPSPSSVKGPGQDVQPPASSQSETVTVTKSPDPGGTLP